MSDAKSFRDQYVMAREAAYQTGRFKRNAIGYYTGNMIKILIEMARRNYELDDRFRPDEYSFYEALKLQICEFEG